MPARHRSEYRLDCRKAVSTTAAGNKKVTTVRLVALPGSTFKEAYAVDRFNLISNLADNARIIAFTEIGEHISIIGSMAGGLLLPS